MLDGFRVDSGHGTCEVDTIGPITKAWTIHITLGGSYLVLRILNPRSPASRLLYFRTVMTTLPDFLFDTYKRYKADTNRVVAWLVETSQKCGHTLESQPTMTSSSSGPRLKGKARTEARKAGTATRSAPSLKHAIAVNGLTDKAQLIANQNPPVKIPK